MRYGDVLEPQGNDGLAAQVWGDVLVFSCASNKRIKTHGAQKVDWHKWELGGSAFYLFIAIYCPPSSLFGKTWSLSLLEEGHEARYAACFQSPGHALCPVCYCLSPWCWSISLKEHFGCPSGQMWAVSVENETEEVDLLDQSQWLLFQTDSKAVTTVLQKRPGCAASHHHQAVESSRSAECVCCLFIGVWWLHKSWFFSFFALFLTNKLFLVIF